MKFKWIYVFHESIEVNHDRFIYWNLILRKIHLLNCKKGHSITAIRPHNLSQLTWTFLSIMNNNNLCTYFYWKQEMGVHTTNKNQQRREGGIQSGCFLLYKIQHEWRMLNSVAPEGVLRDVIWSALVNWRQISTYSRSSPPIISFQGLLFFQSSCCDPSSYDLTFWALGSTSFSFSRGLPSVKFLAIVL